VTPSRYAVRATPRRHLALQARCAVARGSPAPCIETLPTWPPALPSRERVCTQYRSAQTSRAQTTPHNHLGTVAGRRQGLTGLWCLYNSSHQPTHHTLPLTRSRELRAARLLALFIPKTPSHRTIPTVLHSGRTWIRATRGACSTKPTGDLASAQQQLARERLSEMGKSLYLLYLSVRDHQSFIPRSIVQVRPRLAGATPHSITPPYLHAPRKLPRRRHPSSRVSQAETPYIVWRWSTPVGLSHRRHQVAGSIVRYRRSRQRTASHIFRTGGAPRWRELLFERSDRGVRR
jgi:hypothetical protein